jgi:splicing factor 3A subunit 3
MYLQLESEFDECWANGEVLGWEKESVSQGYEINLDDYNTVEELVELGLQKLKKVCSCILVPLLSSILSLDLILITSSYWFLSIYLHFCQALAAHGLKSGGTAQQRAERLFLLKVV